MKRKQSLRGMTLIEAMSSMAVLTIGISGAIGITVDSARSVTRSAHVEEANALAQSLISTLSSAPWSARGSGGASLFANVSVSNDGDIADGGNVFTQNPLPAGSYDHSESEITGSPLAAMVSPLPAGRTMYERYWNIAPITGTNGVSIAVIVRWREGTNWSRVVMLTTRYQP